MPGKKTQRARRHRPLWRRELSRAPSRPESVQRLLGLDEDRTEACRQVMQRRPARVSPAFAALIDRRDGKDPLLRQVLPDLREQVTAPGESGDPLAEQAHQAAPGLIHRYPDRALLLTTGQCASYCRFCTRARQAGDAAIDLQPALEYIRAHSEIREVILSGGDPLMLSDRELDLCLRELRSIAHVQVLRVGTRMPVFVPHRITRALLGILSRARPLYLLLHVNHARELSKACRHALRRLVDKGIPVLSQTVLLRGVNDEVDTLAQLMRELLALRCTPYYLHSCDLALGTDYLRVDLDRAMALHEALRQQISGLALPELVIDLPEGGGKVPLHTGRIIDSDEGGHHVRALDGRAVWVPRPSGPATRHPS